MARIHLFEFEDQPWFPGFLRRYVTDFLKYLSIRAGVFTKIVPLVNETLGKIKSDTIIDLGSGSGGGLIGIYPYLKETKPNLQILLTDLYPHQEAIDQITDKYSGIIYVPESVDARTVPERFKGLRTMFLSFHHFKPSDARAIIQNAIESNSSLLIFESQERSFPSLLAMLFSPLSVILVTPFILPFSVGRLFFTYIIPIVPVVVMWDGIVSSLRTYSLKEMNDLISEVKGTENFTCDTGKIHSGPAKVLYLRIIPKGT